MALKNWNNNLNRGLTSQGLIISLKLYKRIKKGRFTSKRQNRRKGRKKKFNICSKFRNKKRESNKSKKPKLKGK